jgi:hypothetical protein
MIHQTATNAVMSAINEVAQLGENAEKPEAAYPSKSRSALRS